MVVLNSARVNSFLLFGRRSSNFFQIIIYWRDWSGAILTWWRISRYFISDFLNKETFKIWFLHMTKFGWKESLILFRIKCQILKIYRYKPKRLRAGYFLETHVDVGGNFSNASIDICKVLIASKKRPMPQTYKSLMKELLFWMTLMKISQPNWPNFQIWEMCYRTNTSIKICRD